MLTEAQKDDIRAGVEMYLECAEAEFGVKFPRPQIRFKTKGTTAGWSDWFAGELDFNPILGAENFEHFLARTVPHEVAHWVEDAMIFHHKKWKRVYSGTRRQIHGVQWKHVMRVFQVEDSKRTHSYDVSTVRKLRGSWEAVCECPGRMFQISTRMKNQHEAGRKRFCRKCKSTICFTGHRW